MSIRSRIILYISILFFVAIGNVLFTFNLENKSEEKLYWVVHTHEVIHLTDLFLSALQDAETGQRGYLLTNNSTYLEPYYVGLKDSKDILSELKVIVSDNIKQIKVLEKIENDMSLKFEELNFTIKLVDTDKLEQSLQIVRDNKGKEYMDRIRANIKDFIYTEKLLLEQRKIEYEKNKIQLNTLFITELVIFIFLGILTITFINRTLFNPLKLLLNSTIEMEKGNKIDVSNITNKDEMGYLLSSFYKMNHKITSQVDLLDYKAHHDELTGLLNRTTLKNVLSESIRSSKSKTAIIFIDLNNFKKLNDTYGHDIGDEVLKMTSKRLSNSIRLNDSAFRLGGDEFVLIITNIPDIKSLDNLILTINNAFNKDMEILGNNIHTSLSIGVAISPDYGMNPSELLKYADIAMYESKSSKERKYSIYDPKNCIV
ncbi:MAG: diguanylate cyclase [Spirochaetaceae bacterium]